MRHETSSGHDFQRVAGARPIELIILQKDDGAYALWYATHVWTTEGWMQTYIDAQNGELLLRYNDLKTQSAVGTEPGCSATRRRSALAFSRDASRPTMR